MNNLKWKLDKFHNFFLMGTGKWKLDNEKKVMENVYRIMKN